MRISDLSSDVCSSDLNGDQGGQGSRCGSHTSYSRQAGTRSDSPKHSYVSCFLDGTIARECGHGNKDSRLYKSIDLMRVSLIWLRSEEHTSELQSLMRNSYAVFCLKKKNIKKT